MYDLNGNMTSKYNFLEWDSDYFGFKVAKILPNKIDTSTLEKIIGDLKKSNTSLVYWSCDNFDKESEEAANSLNGFLTGQKITYFLDLDTLSKTQTATDTILEIYKEKEPNIDLINLIIKGGKTSRFYVDPKISKKQYEGLQKLWITNSVKNNTIFVVKKKEKIISFVSLNEKNHRGNIDYIIVDEKYQGKGIGSILMNQAHNWFISNGFNTVQADTQQKNTKACNMYEKLGYNIEKIEKFYHFWL